ncbi:hypothetical protein [Arthrobacter sp. M4]|uniref:hypothetical protein n=1 Tax=Arthrobacter sp. M4 TaxID=218160 RepID=UPI001CDB8B0E|nr:hypothetical protein [Arthrobacter sp. M4]MCA4134218.1 hypothetical protein [Arthrobacter sp. M4]
MNGTPRLLNRILIGILGLKLLAIGVLLALLATVPAVGTWWHGWSGAAWSAMQGAFDRTRFPGRSESWLWIVAAAVLVLLIVLMIAWVAQQGKGRVSVLVADDDDGDVPGDVRIGGMLAEQALRSALAERTDLMGSAVWTYEVKGTPGLRVRIEPRQGVAPHALADDVGRLVEALDAVTGKRTPVLLHIASGTRARFTRAERVR